MDEDIELLFCIELNFELLPTRVVDSHSLSIIFEWSGQCKMIPDHLRGSQGHRTYSRRFLQGELFWDAPIEIIAHNLSPCPARQRGIDVV